VPGGFSALSLKLDATRHSAHHNTHPQSGATAATLHHSHRIDPESDTWRFLGSIPAIQPYKIHSQKGIIHEVTKLNGGMLAIPDLDCRFHHNHCSDPGSDCGRLLGSTAATQWYKGRLCRIKTHEIADPCGSSLYRYPGAPRTRCQIPPDTLLRS